MEQYGVGHLPVVDGETVLGVVDREQVVRERILSPGLGF